VASCTWTSCRSGPRPPTCSSGPSAAVERANTAAVVAEGDTVLLEESELVKAMPVCIHLRSGSQCQSVPV
jgi:hypothetical protein